MGGCPVSQHPQTALAEIAKASMSEEVPAQLQCRRAAGADLRLAVKRDVDRGARAWHDSGLEGKPPVLPTGDGLADCIRPTGEVLRTKDNGSIDNATFGEPDVLLPRRIIPPRNEVSRYPS